MRIVDVVFLVGWIAFWVYWLVAAVGVKAGQSRWTQLVGLRIVVVLIVLLLLRARLVKWHVVASPWLQGIGLALFCSGLGLALWARLRLGRNWGTPMSRKADPELITSGPYRRIRHPIYTGIILAMIGTAVGVSLYWLIAVTVLSGYFVYSAVTEERYMTGRFPDTYPEYKRSSKMLMPFIL